MNTAYKWLFLILLFAAPAFAQNVRVDNVAFSSVQGFPFLASATITICTAAGTGTPCTPTVPGLCLSVSDAVCSQPATFTSDALGNYGFWIQPGTYTYTVTKAGFSGFGPKTLTLAVPSAGSGPGTFTNLTASGINKTILVDGVTYPLSRPGIQSAINACAGAVCTVVLPEAFISLDGTPLTISGNFINIVGALSGQGRSGTVLTFPTTNGDVIQISGNTVSISNITFTPASALSGTRTGAVINMSSMGNEAKFYNLDFTGDAAFSAGDCFFDSRSTNGGGIVIYDSILFTLRWNSGWKLVNSASTIASHHISHVLTVNNSDFADAQVVLDGGVDTFVMDNSELFNGAAGTGTNPTVWLRNTVASPTNPRWVFFDHVLVENHNAGLTTFATGVQLDSARSFKYSNGYIASSLIGVAVGANAIDTRITGNVIVNIRQNAVTIAAGSTGSGAEKTHIIDNDFQDIGTQTNNTYPVISANAGSNYFEIIGNTLHKVNATNMPSNFFTLPSGAGGQFSIIGNDFGISGTDFAAATPLSITTSSTSYQVAANNYATAADHVTYGVAQGTLITTSSTDTLTNKTLTNPALTSPTISLLTNGTGLQVFNTTTSCTTAATAFVTCTTAAISLPVAEADTNYRLACTPHGPTNFPILVGTTISSATQFTITIEATTAAAATFASYDCVAGHN